MNSYRIARAKARIYIRHIKKTSWRNYVSKMNSQTSVKSVWIRIRKMKGKYTINTVHHLSVNDNCLYAYLPEKRSPLRSIVFVVVVGQKSNLTGKYPLYLKYVKKRLESP